MSEKDKNPKDTTRIEIKDISESNIIVTGRDNTRSSDTNELKIDDQESFKLDIAKSALVFSTIIAIFVISQFFFGSNPSIDITIDPSYIHLGDNIFNVDYVRKSGGDVPHQAIAQGIVYNTIFDTCQIRADSGVPRDLKLKHISVYLFANHVKPSTPQTVTAYVNGTQLFFLNDYFMQEEFRRQRIEVEIPLTMLSECENIFSILTSKESSAEDADYEDFEVDHIGLFFEFERNLKLISINKWISLGVVVLLWCGIWIITIVNPKVRILLWMLFIFLILSAIINLIIAF